MFSNIETAPADAILGLTVAFNADTNPAKVNLGVGIYKDKEGKTPVMQAVKQAEAILLETQKSKSYLPIAGSPAYGKHVQNLLFGDGTEVIERARAKTFHSPGGTGALRVGADFLATHFAGSSIWVSSPTWANHKGIFGAAGIKINDYAYYNAETHGVDFPGMLADLKNVPAGDVVLLHVCCHNPTGVDLSLAQWAEIADLAQAQGWTPFFDFAYQGFGTSVEEDRKALDPFVSRGLEFFVASSFSKNFGLYNERCGSLTVVSQDADTAARVNSQVLKTVRVNYSNPSNHGGAIVSTILSDAALTKIWRDELDGMRDRIKSMRSSFVKELASRNADVDFSYIEEQRGMFSFSGLNADQVAFLRDEYSIYIVGGGRINVAGIMPSNINYLCDAVAKSLTL